LFLAAPGREPDGDEAFSTGVAQHVLWTGEPLFVEDAASHGELSQHASVQRLNLRSVLGLPLKVAGETIGVMIADSRRIASGFGEAELELALALAQAVALAIGHARRAAAQDARTRELEAVQAVALAAAGARDADTWAQAALARACLEAGADRGFLLLGADLAVLAARGPDGPVATGAASDISRSVCSWVLEQGQALHMVDVQSDDAFAGARSVMALGLRTVWALPVGADALLYLDSQRLREDAGQALGALTAIAGLLAASRGPGADGTSGV
jgi:GAF domain-containing protein